MNEIDEGIARRVLEVVDAGLVAGIGEPSPGEMCVEAAVRYALGLPHGDDPPCVAPALRFLKIRINDARWSSPQARARGLRRLAIASLGSAGALDEIEFGSRVARLAIQTCVPTALRAVAQRHAGEQRERLLQAADLCEREPTRKNALKARAAAYAAAAAAYADAAYDASAAACADTAYDASAAHYDAAAYADAADAADAAAAAADAASYAYASSVYADAAYAAYAAARSADAYYAAVAGTAATAAAAAAAVKAALSDAAAVAAYDDALATFAEHVVHVLRDMGSPGCAFLHLTEAA